LLAALAAKLTLWECHLREEDAAEAEPRRRENEGGSARAVPGAADINEAELAARKCDLPAELRRRETSPLEYRSRSSSQAEEDRIVSSVAKLIAVAAFVLFASGSLHGATTDTSSQDAVHATVAELLLTDTNEAAAAASNSKNEPNVLVSASTA
jgi:hypothetical protein